MEEEIKKEEPNNELLESQKKAEEYLNNWKRSAADFINYKKDEMERMAIMVKYAKEDIILKILPVLDNIYIAEKQLPENLKKGEKGSAQAIEWTKGFLQIQKQITEFLKKEGIEEIPTVGEKFDPNSMEIVAEIEGTESGVVAEELQKGYMMNGKVLRPAKIKISK
jgi:molecular chaperone GrpE